LVSTQNRELSLRCIAYNMHRLTNLIIVLMVSTEPVISVNLRENGIPANVFVDLI